MAYHRDNAPVGPTCPLINDIIDMLTSARHDSQWINDNSEGDIKSESISIYNHLDLAIEKIEDIRNANASLRDWGNDELKEKELLECLVTDLQNEIDDLKLEVLELMESQKYN